MAALGTALGSYVTLDGPMWMLIVLAMVPDISTIGYLAGPRRGRLSYNVVRTYTLPLVLGAFGSRAGIRMALLVALSWAGHIDADRVFGYGLTFESGFKDTHLSTQPTPVEAVRRSDR